MLAALVAVLAGAGEGRAAGLSPDPAPFGYDLLHPDAQLRPQFVDPQAQPVPTGPLDAPPPPSERQDCVLYHQQLPRDLTHPYPGPCLPNQGN